MGAPSFILAFWFWPEQRQNDNCQCNDPSATSIIAIIAFLDGVVSLTATPCTVTMSGCGGTFSIFVLPTDFVVNMSDPIDPATLDASDFTVNGIPANNFYLIKRQHDDNLRLYDLACGAGRQHYAYRRRRF